VFGATGADDFGADWQYRGTSATIDGRIFSSLGVASQTAILASRSVSDALPTALRLDTGWSYSHPVTMITARAGDTISGGLTWTRPTRLGGMQVQRTFALRPALLTLPLPSFGGSAAVPSSVDVFVAGVRSVSQDVSSGPF